ncbi:MAG: hypothetical protein J7639_23505 [Paenibacillaceae bacterium]|nr:hypothetical protein [Paenibacillaceae bacterium]
MAKKVFVSINGDVTEVVKGKHYPKNALIFAPIEKSPIDYSKQKDIAYEEASNSLEQMMKKIDKRTAHA